MDANIGKLWLAAGGALFALVILGGEHPAISSEAYLPTILSCEAVEEPPDDFLRNPAMLELALRLFQHLLNMQFPLEAEREAAEALIDLAASEPEDRGALQHVVADDEEAGQRQRVAAPETREEAQKRVDAAAARLIEIVTDLLALEKADAAEGRGESKKTPLNSPEDIETFVAQNKATRDRYSKTAEAYWLYAQLRKQLSQAGDATEYASQSR